MAQSQSMTDEQSDVASILQAMIVDARWMADLACEFVRRWFDGAEPKSASRFPAEFLLEVSAVLRIADWQRSDIAKELAISFPPADELLIQLLGRLADDPYSFSYDPDHCPSPLSREVMRIWFERCSWTGLRILNADVAVDRTHLDLQVDLLTELLWACRHIKSTRNHHACPNEESRPDLSAPQ
jgi:hypothetical protein